MIMYRSLEMDEHGGIFPMPLAEGVNFNENERERSSNQSGIYAILFFTLDEICKLKRLEIWFRIAIG